MLHQELAAVREEMSSDQPLISAGALSADDPGDDVGLRQGALDAMAQTVQECAEAGVFDDHSGDRTRSSCINLDISNQ